jgi:hypothetical protein
MHSYDDGDLVKPLSGKIGNPPMKICHPEYADNPAPITPELPVSPPSIVVPKRTKT